MKRSYLWISVVMVVGGGCGHNAETPDATTHGKDAPGSGDGGTIDAPGSAECTAPESACGATCVNLQTDPMHCGACDHVCGCGETTCTAGLCDSTDLVSGLGAPFAIALHDGTLFWGTDVDQNVSTVSTAGGTATTLYPDRTAVRGFAFDATHVYFTRNRADLVESGKLDGTGAGNFTNQTEFTPEGIVADATNVYWVDDNGTIGTVRTAKLGDASAATALATDQINPYGIAEDAANLYWTENVANGSILKLPKAGGTPTAIATNQALPLTIATDGTNVYWTNQGTGQPGTGSVQSVSVGGGTITTYATAQMNPVGIAIDASYVYWTDPSADTVSRAAISGGAPQIIAAGEAGPQYIVVDQACMYYADYAGGTAGSGSIRKHDLD